MVDRDRRFRASIVAVLGFVALLLYSLTIFERFGTRRPHAPPPKYTQPAISYPPYQGRAKSIPGVRQDDREVRLTVWTRNGTRNDTAPFLGGLLFEDIAVLVHIQFLRAHH